MCNVNVKDSISKIIENVNIASGIFRMDLHLPDMARDCIPGQFINIKVPNDESLILRRPFSIYDVNGDVLSIIYAVVGKGTKALSEAPKGTNIAVLGPLGNGFTPVKDKTAYVIGGGCGTPPLYFLAKQLRSKNIPVQAYLGFSSNHKIILIEEFNTLSNKVKFSTDDGSNGIQGNVLDILKDENFENTAFYACGPVPLLSGLKEFCKEKNIPLQVSLEERMGCGFGVCLGCAIRTQDGLFKYICKDGPVFDAQEISFQKTTNITC